MSDELKPCRAHAEKALTCLPLAVDSTEVAVDITKAIRSAFRESDAELEAARRRIGGLEKFINSITCRTCGLTGEWPVTNNKCQWCAERKAVLAAEKGGA